ncbi:MAG: protein of unknown function DUF5052 [Bacteriophage sp.]|jgi:hypothetical protein|nr:MULTISPECIES: hypothetical protein [Lachnospiraceae]UWG10590.1 MAG: protein of unknown function DUF5052 [Bacteriophage sp.]
MKKKLFNHKGKIALTLSACLLLVCMLVGCTEVGKVSYNIGIEADNFNVVRRLTVINARTDTVLLQLTGTFALENNENNELEVICELADGKYQKHFVYLNEYTLYVVEDISGSDVDKYSYEINFLPEMVPGVSIKSED